MMAKDRPAPFARRLFPPARPLRRSAFARSRPSLWETVVWSQSMGTMLEGGVTVAAAIETLRSQATSPAMNRFYNAVHADLLKGHSLMEAVEKRHPPYRSMIARMLEAGETTGEMARAFQHLSRFLSDRLDFRNRLISAMAYPALVAGLAAVILAILMVRVVPSVVSVFMDAGVDMPLPTILVIGLSKHLERLWWLDAAIIIAALILWRRVRRHPRVRRFRDLLFLSLPILGPTLALIIARRFLNALADMIGAGIVPDDALDLAARLTGNELAERSLSRARDRIRQGVGMVAALNESGCLPPSVTSLLRSAEESGDLGAGFSRAAHLINGMVEARLATAFALLEPALVLTMSFFVGLMAFAILLPIFEMGALL